MEENKEDNFFSILKFLNEKIENSQPFGLLYNSEYTTKILEKSNYILTLSNKKSEDRGNLCYLKIIQLHDDFFEEVLFKKLVLCDGTIASNYEELKNKLIEFEKEYQTQLFKTMDEIQSEMETIVLHLT